MTNISLSEVHFKSLILNAMHSATKYTIEWQSTKNTMQTMPDLCQKAQIASERENTKNVPVP